MNYFQFTGLIITINCLVLAGIFWNYGKSVLQISGFQLNLAVALWGVGCILIGRSQTVSDASLAWRIAMSGGLFIPICFYKLIYIFSNHKRNIFLRYSYISGLISLYFIWHKNAVLSNWQFLFNSFYYNRATFGYYLMMFNWGIIAVYAHYRLYSFIRKSTGIRRVQALYLFWGSFIGFIGGTSSLLPAFGFVFYPFLNITIAFYAFIVTYAILRYRLLDISIAITRTGIFVAVYSVVLGIPFAIAFGWQEELIKLFGSHWWIIPLVSSTILATAGPFIYLYIQKRAEGALLQEQRQYQTTLRQASLGMGQIKELKRLLQLIVHIVTRAVSVEHCKVFLMHEDSKQLILKASRGKISNKEEVSVLALHSPLIRYLQEIKEPVVYEEVKQRTDDYKENKLEQVESDIKKIDGALVIPSFIEQKLIAILVLGRKKSGKLYTQDDLAVFSILANQAGLAIENAQFYERMKETHMQLVKAEKMATVGTMADGLSHQINNRLHAMGFIAGDAIDTIRLERKKKLTKETEALLDEIEHSLGRIEDNVRRGGEIVEGLLKYTRKGAEGFETINLNKLLDAALEMVQFKIKLTEMDFVRNFDGHIPDIQGNFTQLQEVFFNLIDNAYDAMMQRRSELKEPGYKAHLEIFAEQKDRKLEILIKDNGIGVKKENLDKLFTPFFTTKLSSKKGTGLGLYVIRQIIEENHGGKVSFTSEYQKGSQTKILLPVASQAS